MSDIKEYSSGDFSPEENDLPTNQDGSIDESSLNFDIIKKYLSAVQSKGGKVCGSIFIKDSEAYLKDGTEMGSLVKDLSFVQAIRGSVAGYDSLKSLRRRFIWESRILWDLRDVLNYVDWQPALWQETVGSSSGVKLHFEYAYMSVPGVYDSDAGVMVRVPEPMMESYIDTLKGFMYDLGGSWGILDDYDIGGDSSGMQASAFVIREDDGSNSYWLSPDGPDGYLAAGKSHSDIQSITAFVISTSSDQESTGPIDEDGDGYPEGGWTTPSEMLERVETRLNVVNSVLSDIDTMLGKMLPALAGNIHPSMAYGTSVDENGVWSGREAVEIPSVTADQVEEFTLLSDGEVSANIPMLLQSTSVNGPVFPGLNDGDLAEVDSHFQTSALIGAVKGSAVVPEWFMKVTRPHGKIEYKPVEAANNMANVFDADGKVESLAELLEQLAELQSIVEESLSDAQYATLKELDLLTADSQRYFEIMFKALNDLELEISRQASFRDLALLESINGAINGISIQQKEAHNVDAASATVSVQSLLNAGAAGAQVSFALGQLLFDNGSTARKDIDNWIVRTAIKTSSGSKIKNASIWHTASLNSSVQNVQVDGVFEAQTHYGLDVLIKAQDCDNVHADDQVVVHIAYAGDYAMTDVAASFEAPDAFRDQVPTLDAEYNADAERGESFKELLTASETPAYFAIIEHDETDGWEGVDVEFPRTDAAGGQFIVRMKGSVSGESAPEALWFVAKYDQDMTSSAPNTKVKIQEAGSADEYTFAVWESLDSEYADKLQFSPSALDKDLIITLEADSEGAPMMASSVHMRMRAEAVGCDDPEATNYDAQAPFGNFDALSCQYPEGYFDNESSDMEECSNGECGGTPITVPDPSAGLASAASALSDAFGLDEINEFYSLEEAMMLEMYSDSPDEELIQAAQEAFMEFVASHDLELIQEIISDMEAQLGFEIASLVNDVEALMGDVASGACLNEIECKHHEARIDFYGSLNEVQKILSVMLKITGEAGGASSEEVFYTADPLSLKILIAGNSIVDNQGELAAALYEMGINEMDGSQPNDNDFSIIPNMGVRIVDGDGEPLYVYEELEGQTGGINIVPNDPQNDLTFEQAVNGVDPGASVIEFYLMEEA